MPDDVSLNKVAIIERCIERITQVHAGDDEAFLHDLNRQDSILLNLQRACEAAIDLAMRAVSIHRLGLPQETRHAFELLRDAGLVSADVTERMVRMVGFRNLAVHDYRALDLDVVLDIVAHRLDDFRDFASRHLPPTPTTAVPPLP
ncbi:MAG: type VII toxin-antitoxin system HepT family RNase toxin [Alphaproteobacteria bacterium]